MYCTPGPDNSNLISTENAVPNKPENSANIRYKVPISLALLDKNQRSHHIEISDLFFILGKMEYIGIYLNYKNTKIPSCKIVSYVQNACKL